MTTTTTNIYTGSDVAQDKKVCAHRRSALAEAISSRRGKINYRILDNSKVQKTNAVSAKTRTRIGHWNVRTLYSTGKSFILAKELSRLNIKICGISETHWTGRGRMSANGYTIWYSGTTEGGRHERGVAIAIESRLTGSVSDVDFVNERIIKVRMKCKHADITVVE